MKTISGTSDLVHLESNLVEFILKVSPWLDDPWDAEEYGYIFILDEGDVGRVSSIFTAPHIENPDEEYKEAMTIDLATFDYWEAPAYHDDVSGYWNVVAIFGQEYGCSLFMSSAFVEAIPELQQRLKEIVE